MINFFEGNSKICKHRVLIIILCSFHPILCIFPLGSNKRFHKLKHKIHTALCLRGRQRSANADEAASHDSFLLSSPSEKIAMDGFESDSDVLGVKSSERRHTDELLDRELMERRRERTTTVA